MNLEELLAKIEKDDIKEAIVDLINAEKERGKDAYRKKDQELMSWKTKFKDLGYDPTKYDNNVDLWITDVKNKDKAVTESKMTIAQLNSKIEEIKRSWENEKERNRQIQQKAKENKLQAELTNKIGNMFLGSNYLIKDIIRDGRADIDDNGLTIDGLPIEQAIEKLKTENKDILRVSQSGGTGDNGGSTYTNVEKTLVQKIKERMNSNN